MYDEQTQPNQRLQELEGFIAAQIPDSVGFMDSELSEFREKASDLYYGRPYGDEVDGQSKVVSRDVMETIEWVLAQLLRIFVGDKFCEFEPFGPEDVESAEQQTDFVNHVLMNDCNGAVLLYDWFKEALMRRYAVVHWGYCDYYEPTTETYTGLSDEQFAAVLMDGEPVEHSMRQEIMPDGQPITLHDVRIRRVNKSSKFKIESIPSEEFFINRRARTLDEAVICGHKSRRTKSDLLSEGFPQDVLDGLSPDDDESEAESIARNVDKREGTGNDDTELFWLYTCYVKFDLDGDGYAERLRVRYLGGEIVGIDPVTEVPYADLCPIRTPGRLIGLSYTDAVEDIQRIKTVLMRQGLDNLYLSNKPQREVVEGQVNLNDLQTAKVGGNIRTKQPGMIRDLQVPNMLGPTLQMVQYMDMVREERTGTSAASQGRDADQIHDTAKGMAQMVSQAQMRVELVARLFAEGGVKRLFVGIYNAICRNQDPARMVRLRGKFVQIDPREWRERNNAVVTVGLGVGTKDAQIATLQGVLGMQMQMLQTGLPLVTPDKIRHTMTKLIQAAGFSNVDSFLARPEEIPPPPPPPPPESIVIAGIQREIEGEKRALEAEKANIEAQIKTEQERTKRAELEMRDRDAQRAHELRMAELGLKKEQLAQDEQHFYDKLTHDAVLNREKLMQSAEQARAEAAKDEALMAALGDGPAEGAEPDDAKPKV